MITNKTILLGCKEDYTFPTVMLGKYFEKNKNNVHYYFLNSSDVMQKNIITKDNFFKIKENLNASNVHDVSEVALKMQSKIEICENRLKEIESKYTYFSTLNEQLLSSQFTSTPYHDRFYYQDPTYKESLCWLMLNYDSTEKLFDKIKPDYIFDLDVTEIQRTIINEIAHNRGIPFISFEHSRYKTFLVPTFSISRKVDQYFLKKFDENKKNQNLDKYINEVLNYRTKSNIMSESYNNTVTSENDFSFKQMIKYISVKIYENLLNRIYILKNYKYNLIKSYSAFNSNPFKRFIYLILYSIRKFYLYSSFNKYFSIVENEKYVYLPLHYVPESSTFVKSPQHVNEMTLIEAISKTMPINWKLYVKEHPAMIGERSFKFYKRCNRLHNVKLVKSNHYKDPKNWIEQSLAVVTITGTSAFEAAMLNKPAIVFGESVYNVLSNVKVAKNYDELKSLFELVDNNNWPKDNINESAAYIKTAVDVGVDLNMFSLIHLSNKKILEKKINVEEEKELKNLENKLITFFDKALNL